MKKLLKILFILLVFISALYSTYFIVSRVFFTYDKNNQNLFEQTFRYYIHNDKYTKHEDKIYNIYLTKVKKKIYVNTINNSNIFKIYEDLEHSKYNRPEKIYIETNYFNNLDELIGYAEKLYLYNKDLKDMYVEFDNEIDNGSYILYIGPYSYESDAKKDIESMSKMAKHFKVIRAEELYAYQHINIQKNLLNKK